MNREQLIEKAAKAMLDYSHGEGTWEMREPMEEELYLRRARAAFAVFEEANTPTDDEREALVEFFYRVVPQLHAPLRTKVAEEWADKFIAEFGFHRTVQGEPKGRTQEPSAERLAARAHYSNPDHHAIAQRYLARTVQGEPTDAREAMDRLECEHLPHLDRLGGDWNQVARDIREAIAALRAAAVAEGDNASAGGFDALFPSLPESLDRLTVRGKGQQ